MDPNQQRLHPVRTSPPSRTWLTTKLALTSLSIFCCIVVLGISIGLAVDPDVQSYVVVWTAPQAGAALLWSIAESATLCALRAQPAHRGIHPGAHVAVQLLLWLAFGAGLGLTARLLKFAVAFTASDDPDVYPEYNAYYYGENEDNYEYYSDSYVHSMEALVAFLVFLIIIHLFLFARACVETTNIKRDRKTKAAAIIELRQSTRLSNKGKQDVEPNMA